ncbi:calpain-2 catalytic subunit-like [Eleutherodactylus coqui]|uniref:calpain-2 catalytic subunit-like n=1 Tax=Eleutherodactylus coqui TaxID=57060 RepID=UPI0034631B39
MAYSDWIKEFTWLDICNLHPDSLTSTEQHKWRTTMFNGNWIRGSTAGGCLNFPETPRMGRGFWRLNSSLLEEEEIRQSFEDFLQSQRPPGWEEVCGD